MVTSTLPSPVAVLGFESFRAVLVELCANADLFPVAGGLFDRHGLAVAVAHDAVGLAVAVGVRLLADGLAVLEREHGVGLAVEVPIVALHGGLAAAELDPLIGLAVAVGVPLLLRGLAVGVEEEPDVDPAVAVGVALAPLRDARLVVDGFVRSAIAIGVGQLAGEPLLVVVFEDDLAGALGRDRRRRLRARSGQRFGLGRGRRFVVAGVARGIGGGDTRRSGSGGRLRGGGAGLREQQQAEQRGEGLAQAKGPSSWPAGS